ncbi:MAG: dienelactone hydrolase family protein [Saprospiraceae bacterium]|nr:dienelactone hydrolase family protein [Saprospiraceae bacterium]
MKTSGICFLFLIILISACKKEDTGKPDAVKGKNRFTMTVDGDIREYYVHVPGSYDPDQQTPVVFMLHGTSGDGEKFYNISGWKEVGEAENILTVFPSSWHHCIIDNGDVMNTTKWNIYPGGFEYCAGEVPRDDIKFLRQIISELNDRYNVDPHRIYLVGFSNGGQMAFRCAVEMSDQLAAIVQSAASTPHDTTAVPKRNIPVVFQLGNEDDRYFSTPFPLSLFDFSIQNVQVFQKIAHAHTNTFQYDSNYVMSGDTNSVVYATFPSLSGGDRTFIMAMIKDLGHAYPNGTNHWMNGAQINWNWMKQFTLP